MHYLHGLMCFVSVRLTYSKVSLTFWQELKPLSNRGENLYIYIVYLCIYLAMPVGDEGRHLKILPPEEGYAPLQTL